MFSQQYINKLMSSLRHDDTNLILHVLVFSSQSLPWLLLPQTPSWQDLATLHLLQYYIDIQSHFSQKGYHQGNKHMNCEDIEKRGLLYTVGAMQISAVTMEISMGALHKM
jgi:hypothetical protein